MKKIIGIIFMIMGLVVIVYPKASESYYNYQQQRFVEEWQESLLNIDSEDIDGPGESIEDPGIIVYNDDSDAEEIGKQKEEYDNKEYIKNNMEGMLKIDKIDLNLPILKGATHKNLLMSLASIDKTGKPGEIGNYSIAGHRNRTYGRNFNRLEEVIIGDVIEFDNGKDNFKYTVSEKLYVKPDETWVLLGNKKDKEITLVTCHPMINPTHRLIIKGKVKK